MVKILDGAEAFTFDGNDTGILVLHGFTGSPMSVRYLGEGLHKKFGFSVVGPRLPGHGTSPDDIEKTGYLDWLGKVEDELHMLSQRKKKLFVTGLSMGGTLTLNLAARFHNKISGIATIAASAGILGAEFSDLLTAPAPTRMPGMAVDVKDPQATAISYHEVPMTSMRDLGVLALVTRNLMDRITCPALVMHPREDHTVPPENAMEIVKAVKSDDIRMLWLNNSYHVATIDYDKDLIIDRIGNFFTEISKS